MGEERISVGKPEGKIPRPRRGWMDNIKMDNSDRIGWYGLD
jgi:hypothetical protein